MTTSTSRPAPFSGGNSLTVTSGPEQPPLSATSGSYDNRRRVAPDICSCRFLSRPPAYRFRRTAASRQQRPVDCYGIATSAFHPTSDIVGMISHVRKVQQETRALG